MQINKKSGYIRVSSKSQESNSSIKYQKEQLIQNGIQPENIRIEIGSATNKIKNRLVFQKLIQEEMISHCLNTELGAYGFKSYVSPDKTAGFINDEGMCKVICY